jgi:hypothetical protein
MTVVRTAVDAAQDIREMFPNQDGGAPTAPTAEEDDDNPIKIIDPGFGKIKLAVGKDDGRMRWAETGMMALPDMLKWVGEQRESIQKAHSDQHQRDQASQMRSLPPGYVEVGPGYTPPAGFVAVPVDPREVAQQPQQAQQFQQPAQQPLPPPPADMPPPLQPKRAWGAPVIVR